MSSSGARFAVPREHASILAIPPVHELAGAAAANTARLGSSAVDLLGVSFTDLREQAQAAVIAQAVDYTGQITGCEIQAGTRAPLIVTGHQPELFHAGVWAKNFATGAARGSHGLGLNLIIDNDTVTGNRIRVPVGSRNAPSIEWLPFDATQPQQPWEEAAISDPDCFRSFGQRVRARIRACWHYEPLAATGWDAAIRQSAVAPRLFDCLVAARLSIERSHGLHNLEVPMSRVCQTLPFCQFAALLLLELPRFHAHYNDAVRQYRKRHRMRSGTHPVPELERDDQWLEAPFWVWRRGDRRRERPFARRIGSEIELRDSREVLIRLPREVQGAAAALVELERREIRFRTRALTTTLFARLFLADLFIHGIGGAKYDEMTDQICRQFLGLEPPPYATVSATVHLPLAPAYPVNTEIVRNAEQNVRDFRYNPDRQCGGSSDPAVSRLVEDKRQLIAQLNSRHPTAQEHRRLVELNTALATHLAGIGRSLQADCERLRRETQANSILQNREYSWCLQPESMVSDFFERTFRG